MIKIHSFVFYFTMLIVASFCRERDITSKPKIIGGQKASLTEFPSTLFLLTGCTGVKIARDKILTAAHCVVSKETGQIKAQFLPEEKKPLVIVYHDEVSFQDSSNELLLNIVDVSVHKAYLDACKKHCDDDRALASISPNPKDLAVITVSLSNQLFDSIPTSSLNLIFNEKDYELKMVGFGCEIDAELIPQEPFRLKSADAFLFPFSDLLNENLVETSTISTLYQNYFITKGRSYDSDGASLCPGDSGGPLYVKKRNSSEPWQLAGIHSFAMASKQNQNGISVFNAHSKIDLSDFISSKSQTVNMFDQVFLKEDCSHCRLVFKLDPSFKKKSQKTYSEVSIASQVQKLLRRSGITVWINANSVEISKKNSVVVLNIKAAHKKSGGQETLSFTLLKKSFEKERLELLSSRKL